MANVRISDRAARDLAGLDRAVAQRIIARIRWLAENLSQIRPESLTGELAGLFKLRVGDYRVIYQILDEGTILILAVGHRREIYRQR